MITVPVMNLEGKEIDTVTLDGKVFDGTVNEHAVYQSVRQFRASQRKGLASTKTRGEVSGGGKKPWKQKGTGRARVGSIRSPLWRHGGVTFGPHPRDFSFPLPQRIKLLALKSALVSKIHENGVVVVDNFDVPHEKTKDMAKALSKLNVAARDERVLIVVDAVADAFKRVLRNLKLITITEAKDVNAYAILAARKVVISKDALADLVKRLKGSRRK